MAPLKRGWEVRMHASDIAHHGPWAVAPLKPCSTAGLDAEAPATLRRRGKRCAPPRGRGGDSPLVAAGGCIGKGSAPAGRGAHPLLHARRVAQGGVPWEGGGTRGQGCPSEFSRGPSFRGVVLRARGVPVRSSLRGGAGRGDNRTALGTPLRTPRVSVRNTHPPAGDRFPHAVHGPPHPMQSAPGCSRPPDPCNRTTQVVAGECDCACGCVALLCACVLCMCDALCGRTMTPHLAAGPRAPGTIRWASGRCGWSHTTPPATRTITLGQILTPQTTSRLPGVIPRNVVLHGVWCGYTERRAAQIGVRRSGGFTEGHGRAPDPA